MPPAELTAEEVKAKKVKNEEYAAQVALKKKQAKERKAVRRNAQIKATLTRLVRTFYSFMTMVLCLFAFVASISMVVGYQWAHNTDKTTAQWTSVSVLGHNCTCDNLHESYCAESSDAFQGTSYLSLAVLVCEFLVGVVLTWELASFGVYGGTHDTTRLCLLFALVAMATQMLSLVAFHSAFAGQHCGDQSFEQQGYQIGWAFYYRAFELLLMVLYVLFTLRAFSTSTRGPPSGALLMIVVQMGLTGVSTQAHGWMFDSTQTKAFSTWESCLCEPLCDAVSGNMTGALVLLIFQAIFSVLASFFSSLRAVDNEGLTVKYNIVFSALALLCGIILSVFYMTSVASGSTVCGSTSVFDYQWTLNLEIAVCVGLFLGIILNAILLKPTVLKINGKEVALQEPVSAPVHDNQTEDEKTMAKASDEEQQAQFEEQKKVAANLPPILLYHTWWWFELKDPRTVSHERREGDESDLDSDSDEEEDELLNKSQQNGDANGEDSKSQTEDSRKSAWSGEGGTGKGKNGHATEETTKVPAAAE